MYVAIKATACDAEVTQQMFPIGMRKIQCTKTKHFQILQFIFPARLHHIFLYACDAYTVFLYLQLFTITENVTITENSPSIYLKCLDGKVPKRTEENT